MRTAIRDNDEKMHTIRKEHYKQMTDTYIHEVNESWRQRDAYGANQYMRLAAGSKFGTKKRDDRTVQHSLPMGTEWGDLLSLPGAEGGMLA